METAQRCDGAPAVGFGGVVLAQDPATTPCVEPAPCVYVTPDPAVEKTVGTVYEFPGQGWRAGSRVWAEFASFCPPDAFCDSDYRVRRFRADGDGRFVFRLRYSPRRGGPLPEPWAHGGDHEFELATFSQRRGRRASVTRDAIPPPPPSTPAERAEAGALAEAVQRAHRALERREGAASRALERSLRAERKCDALIEYAQGRNERLGRVSSALFILFQDKATLSAVRRQLEAFAVELASLSLSDPVLRAGAEAWIAAIRRERAWPRKSLCTLLRRWRRADWAPHARPVDPAAVGRISFTSEILDSEALDAAERRMRALAAGRRNAERFGGGLYEGGELDGNFG